MPEKRSGLVRYEDVGDDYLDRRKLRKSAGWILLWALGVGAVISGDYAGWNKGLIYGGFWGLAIGTVLMAVMYVCMVFTITELSTALPHAGGFFSFTRNAFGPTGGRDFWRHARRNRRTRTRSPLDSGAKDGVDRSIDWRRRA